MIDETMLLHVVRDVDGESVVYRLLVPRRRLVDVMRVENLKPGNLISATPVSE